MHVPNCSATTSNVIPGVVKCIVTNRVPIWSAAVLMLALNVLHSFGKLSIMLAHSAMNRAAPIIEFDPIPTESVTLRPYSLLMTPRGPPACIPFWPTCTLSCKGQAFWLRGTVLSLRWSCSSAQHTWSGVPLVSWSTCLCAMKMDFIRLHQSLSQCCPCMTVYICRVHSQVRVLCGGVTEMIIHFLGNIFISWVGAIVLVYVGEQTVVEWKSVLFVGQWHIYFWSL